MPSITVLAGWLGGILTLVAYVPYFVSILKGFKPNRATWFIWASVSAIIAFSYYDAGARDTIWVVIAYCCGSPLIAGLSLKYGEGGWTPFDRKCILAAGISLLLWWFFKTPMVALVMNIAIDYSGALPTIKKLRREPKSEDPTAWALFFAGSIANLFAINHWTFRIAVYPLSQFIIIGVIMALILRRPKTV